MSSWRGIPLVTVTPSPAAGPVASSTAASSPLASPPLEALGPVTPERTPRAQPSLFQDFDSEAVYKQVINASLREDERNFVVCFGAKEAQVASNLTESELVHFLDQPRAAARPVRWINIWNPGEQRGLVKAIGRHYGFSRRLTMSIWAWDAVRMELRRQRHTHQPHGHRGHSRGKNRSASSVASRPPSTPSPLPSPSPSPAHSLELGPGSTRGRSESMASKSLSLSPALRTEDDQVWPAPGLDVFVPENLATFQTMQDNLNYTSIDQGTHFVCIGANWLYRRPASSESDPSAAPSLVPPKHWSWFALCDDNTVLSFHEAASFDKVPKGEDRLAWEAQELASMRANTLKVLRQLSRHGLEHDKHQFMQLTSIRQPMMEQESAPDANKEEQALDAASNLFYYLFEDYSAAFDILNGSRNALDAISGQILGTDKGMFTGPTSHIIPTLYKLNKDLRQLRNLFTNYKTLIDRLLGSAPDGAEGRPRQEQLSARAQGRFRRLQVQLQSLMLDAIADYLDEKVSLQDTYFNLMTQKDSRATERLTRSATLLAKLSVFFLPISFMTSYFSVQIPHLTDGYTPRTYWGAFGVIVSVSFLCLFFFGRVLMFVSERLDGVSDAVVHWLLAKAGWFARRERRARAGDDES